MKFKKAQADIIARQIRRRFTPDQIARLLAVACWDWPIDHILRNEASICGADVAALERAAP